MAYRPPNVPFARRRPPRPTHPPTLVAAVPDASANPRRPATERHAADNYGLNTINTRIASTANAQA